uniref:A2 mating type protein n=1 Tax=Heterobasidion irregulare TaxID=984962 RepID=S5R6Z2_9AGAM|nr:a2 mating type protein [Heterobasidion irregulare]
MPSIRENDFLNGFPQAISILSQLCLRISGSRELSLPAAECNGSADWSSPTAYHSPQRCLSLTLPRPLTSDLLALGLPLMMVQDISDTYMSAATRLKAKLEARFEPRGADSARLEMKLLDGFSVARSQVHVRTIFASHFKRTVASWAEVGMLSTQRWLLTASLKNRLQSCSLVQPAREEAYVTTLPHTDRRTPGTTLFDIFDKTEPSTPCIPIGKKTKHSASLVTRYSTISSCDGTLDQTIPELARLAPVIKPYLDAGLKSNQGAAIKGPKPQRSAGQNPSPTSWGLTSLIDGFDSLSIRDRSKSAGLKDEDDTCKAAPSGHIFTLSKHSSLPIICLPTPAEVQSKASSSHPRSPLQSSYDIHSTHSTSSHIQGTRQRKFPPCPNRDLSMQSTYKAPDALFSHQTNDATIASSAATAKQPSDPTGHCLSPSASTRSRRRKIAPLPPRCPSTNTTALANTVSPDIHVSSQTASLVPTAHRQYCSEIPTRLNWSLSRSPSLTSLSSNGSDLSSSDDLETPPSSPTAANIPISQPPKAKIPAQSESLV